MKILVIPSNRETHLREFLRAWRNHGDWDRVVVVEDNAVRTFCLAKDSIWPLHHISHAEGQELLGRIDTWIISRRDSACRALGFLVAAQLGAEWILTLDDDVRPWSGPICAGHLAVMESHCVCRPTAGMRTRGLPYRELGRILPALNMGLWTDVPDLDAVQSLTAPLGNFMPPAGSWLANPRQRYPVCGMNLFFHVSLLPALYFPPMGDGQPYRRFDDIWMGWAFQRLAERCDIAWSFGQPWISHHRASDPFKNLTAEAAGIQRNETIWRELNEIPLSSRDLAAAAGELADGMRGRGGSLGYLGTWGEALSIWLRHCPQAPLSVRQLPSASRDALPALQSAHGS